MPRIQSLTPRRGEDLKYSAAMVKDLAHRLSWWLPLVLVCLSDVLVVVVGHASVYAANLSSEGRSQYDEISLTRSNATPIVGFPNEDVGRQRSEDSLLCRTWPADVENSVLVVTGRLINYSTSLSTERSKRKGQFSGANVAANVANHMNPDGMYNQRTVLTDPPKTDGGTISRSGEDDPASLKMRRSLEGSSSSAGNLHPVDVTNVSFWPASADKILSTPPQPGAATVTLPAPPAQKDNSGLAPTMINCSMVHALLALRVRVDRQRSTAKVGVYACPDVRLMRLQLIGGGRVAVQQAPLKVALTSCAGVNDTVILTKGRHRSHLVLLLSLGQPLSTSEVRLNYSYSVHNSTSDRVASTVREPLQDVTASRTTPTGTGVHTAPAALIFQPAGRVRRSPQNQLATAESTTVNSSKDLVVDDHTAITSTADCGRTKTCIRYGSEGCGHLTCEYMLSYAVVDNADVDLELSATGSGWVAVGFSSDKFMGGSDDVVGCKREQRLSPPVVSLSLGNSAKHSAPEEKTNRLTLLGGRLHNDHIYCRLRRPMAYKERDGDTDLDLFNDWHQLYAYGDIDAAGRMQRHTQTPRVSDNKIAIIRVTNIMVTSTASFPLPVSAVVCLLSFLLPSTLTFTQLLFSAP